MLQRVCMIACCAVSYVAHAAYNKTRIKALVKTRIFLVRRAHNGNMCVWGRPENCGEFRYLDLCVHNIRNGCSLCHATRVHELWTHISEISYAMYGNLWNHIVDMCICWKRRMRTWTLSPAANVSGCCLAPGCCFITTGIGCLEGIQQIRPFDLPGL